MSDFTNDLFKFYIVFKTKAIDDEELLKLFVEMMRKHERFYHWDEKAKDIISGKTGQELFTAEECEPLDEIVAYLYCGELFDLTIV